MKAKGRTPGPAPQHGDAWNHDEWASRVREAWRRDIKETQAFIAPDPIFDSKDIMLQIADRAYFPSMEKVLERMRR